MAVRAGTKTCDVSANRERRTDRQEAHAAETEPPHDQRNGVGGDAGKGDFLAAVAPGEHRTVDDELTEPVEAPLVVAIRENVDQLDVGLERGDDEGRVRHLR